MILSNEDRNTISSLLRGEVAELNDDGKGTYRRLAELFEKAPDEEYVYMLLWETDMWGVWTNPRDAAKWLLEGEDEDERTIHGETDVDKIAEKMLTSDYPALVKIPVNPTGEPWYMDR